MPYILPDIRAALKPHYEYGPINSGELNYQFSMLARDYIERLGLSYKIINDVVGALEGAKLEFFARVARPYEDKKKKENGDVWDLPKDLTNAS